MLTYVDESLWQAHATIITTNQHEHRQSRNGTQKTTEGIMIQDAERLLGVRAQCPARALISMSATLQSALMQQAAVPGITRSADNAASPHRDTRILEAIKSALIGKEVCRSAAPVPS
jgi:hypothetical protein